MDTGLPISVENLRNVPSMKDAEQEIARLMTNIEEFLVLKRGAMVMLTYNLSVEEGLCNGSQGIIQEIKDTPLGLSAVVEFRNGLTRCISPHYWQSEEYPVLAVAQVPLILAWALTIHKIQGATLDCAEMDLGISVFEYGQTYVALSRVKTLDGLFIKQFRPEKIKAHPLVQEYYSTFLQPKIEEEHNIHPNIQLKLEEEPEEPKVEEPEKPKVEDNIQPNIQPKVEEPKVAKTSDEGCCVICLDKPANTTLVHGTTGHLCCCNNCAASVSECPICRESITSVVRVFST
jgi:hypothetical protein